MKIQITQATITPTCRLNGDDVSIERALDEIRIKLKASLEADANDDATFQIVATIER